MRPARGPSSPRGQRGYILALNIAVLALMMVGATYIGQRMSVALKLAQAEQQRLDEDIALESARARVLFLLATAPRSRSGLGSIGSLGNPGVGAEAVALDGRYYRVGKGVLVSLQDVRGLVSLNGIGFAGASRLRAERLLGTYGLDDLTASRLTDILLDFRDADDLRRINGAERADYAAAGQESFLRNKDLLAPTDLGRLLRWPDYRQLWDDDPITNHVSIEPTPVFNPNTANWRALVAMTGITTEIAKGLVNSRRKGEIADISRLVVSGNIDDPFSAVSYISLFPGDTILVTLRSEDSSWGYRMAVTHKPESDQSPWHIQYAYRVALGPLATPRERIPALPEAGALRDFNAKDRIELPF